MTRKIRVVVIDDSAFMRKSLTIMLENDDNIKVVGTAKDGEEGYKVVKELRPDVVTLDVEMPNVDGLTALQRIMEDCPTAVIMVSSLTTDGADSTLKALEYGAIDFIPKDLSFVSVNIVKIQDELIAKVKSVASKDNLRKTLNRVRGLCVGDTNPVKTTTDKLKNFEYEAVGIGISTGGPLTLQKFIPSISADFDKPIFLVQHMPPFFTKSLAERLNSLSLLEVKEATNNEFVRNGTVYIAPGGKHMTLLRKSINGVIIKISDEPEGMLHKPSVDIMINSMVNSYGNKTLGIIMTGMGKDGKEGINNLKNAGGKCLAQDEETSVIYGMPKAVVEAGLADAVLPINKFSDILNKGNTYGKRISRTGI